MAIRIGRIEDIAIRAICCWCGGGAGAGGGGGGGTGAVVVIVVVVVVVVVVAAAAAVAVLVLAVVLVVVVLVMVLVLVSVHSMPPKKNTHTTASLIQLLTTSISLPDSLAIAGDTHAAEIGPVIYMKRTDTRHYQAVEMLEKTDFQQQNACNPGNHIGFGLW